MLTGGCYCGGIRYEVGGAPFNQTNCHCTICRRTTGAPFVAWFSVPRADLRILQGDPVKFRSTPRAIRTFCGRCGAQLTFAADDEPGEIDITTASLDDPNAAPPRDHIWTASRLKWIHLADGLPEYRQRRVSGSS